jgi:hypothetical protein
MSLLQVIARATQSFIEQRRSTREQVNFPAWIELGLRSQRRDCTVLDVSEGGARIALSSKEAPSKEFWLVLSKDGTRRRRCRLIWRTGDQIGVGYLGPIQSSALLSLLN